MKYFLLLLLCFTAFGCSNNDTFVESKPNKSTDLPYPTESPSGFSMACSKQDYNPVCGEVIVQCVTTPCDPIQETFPNVCAANEANALNIQPGSCEGDDETAKSSDDLYNAFFIDRSPETCATLRFTCEENQTPFSDERGCGCINTAPPPPPTDKKVLYENILIYGETPNECPSVGTKIDCPPTWNAYNDASGCGCFKE